MANTNPAFMSGVPELLILRLLSGREMYGYELVKAIRRTTGESIVLAEGVVYPALHGLEKKGCLRASRKPVEGRTRVYYTVTAKGKKRFQALSAQWEKISGGVNTCLAGVGHV